MTDEESLEWFKEHKFYEALDETYHDIDPQKSKDIFQGGSVDTIVSVFVLFWRALQQAWPLVIIGMALIGWREPIRTFTQALFGIKISVSVSMTLTAVAIAILTSLGYLLFFRWGSQQKTFLSNQKQNSAQALDYRFKRAMAKWAMKHKRYHKKMEGKLEDKEMDD